MTETIAEKPHAELGPSGWDRWSTCPGSVPLSRGRKNKGSVYAAWGTVAHEIADICLRDNVDAWTFDGKTFVVDGHEIVVDEEMVECVLDYVNTVHQFINVEAGDVLMSEQQVPIGHLTGETDAEGTADAIGIINGGTRLVVVDLKTGKGVPVSAIGNGQGRMYALGALEKFGAVYDEIVEVEIVIVQPRLPDGTSSEIITIEELMEFSAEVTVAAGMVNSAVAEPGNLAAYLMPNEKACKFCDAKAICPALRSEVEGSMRTLSTASADDFEDLTLPKKASSLVPAAEIDSEKLAEAFRAIPLIEDWVKAVEGEVLNRLMAGTPIPGFYLGVGKAGHRKWGNAETAEAELKKRFKVDEMYDKKVISPTKAEKLMKAQPRIWAKVVEAAGIEQPEGKPKVCRDGVDKNPVYALPSPDDFDDLTVDDTVVLVDLD
jgi:hypothetical protein